MGIAPLLLILQAWSPTQVSPDSAQALRDLAERAEWTYESLLRSMAPVHRGPTSGPQQCDEIIGRFCLTFAGGKARRPDTTIAGKVISARQLAVEMLRRAFAELPGDLATAGPLLRYLIEDGRAEEAVAAARTFAWASRDSAWGAFLVGYALHAAAQDSLAELYFAEGLAHLPATERRRIEKVSFLLEHRERSRYEKLSEAKRTAYEEALWRLADPLYLTAGNERYAEHLARHVWSRLLGQAPRVQRMVRWGDDLEQLTIRYGVPTSRERVLGELFSNRQESMIEYYDPEQLAYLVEALDSRGAPPTPPPGMDWDLDNERARSGYRPLTIRRLRPLDHQVSRFPAGDSSILRIDASIALDSVARGAQRARTGFFILDQEYRQIMDLRDTAEVRGDSIAISSETVLLPGRYVYSLEVLEDSTRFAGRARYTVELDSAPASRFVLSDPLVAASFGTAPLPLRRDDGRLRPRSSLIFAPTDTIGLYAEAHHLRPGGDNLAHFQVELKVGAAESPSLLARAWGWMGRKIGLAKPATTPRLAWEGVAAGGVPAILAVDLPLAGLKPGLYALELTMTDQVTAETLSSTRLIRIAQ
jgi:hypothetical protein